MLFQLVKRDSVESNIDERDVISTLLFRALGVPRLIEYQHPMIISGLRECVASYAG